MSLLAGTWAGEPSAGIEPIPGDPGGLQAAAAGLRAAAGTLEDARARLVGIASGLSGPTWSGEGAASFATRAQAFGDMHSTASGTLAQGAAALNSYAAVLEACQAQVRTAQRQAAEAEAWASQAMASLSSSALPAHDPAATAQRASAIAAVEDELSRQLAAARALAAEAWSTYEAGAQTAAGQLSGLVPTWQALARQVGQWRTYAAGMTPAPSRVSVRLTGDDYKTTFSLLGTGASAWLRPLTGDLSTPSPELPTGTFDPPGVSGPTDIIDRPGPSGPTGTFDPPGVSGPTIHINVPGDHEGTTVNYEKPGEEEGTGSGFDLGQPSPPLNLGQPPPPHPSTSGSALSGVLGGLQSGRDKGVWTVGSAQDLQKVFGELTQNGTPTTWKGYSGPVYKLPDGTKVGLRPSSRTGGPTIDIRTAGGDRWKIHLR